MRSALLYNQTLKGASDPEAPTPKNSVHFWSVADQVVLAVFLLTPWNILGDQWPGCLCYWTQWQFRPEGRRDNVTKESPIAENYLQSSVNRTPVS